MSEAKVVALSTVKIVVVDDHPAVREALEARCRLHADLEICGEADNVADALKVIHATKPDIIITDITLKEGDGIDLIKRVRGRDPNARFLVWSMHGEDLYAERALRAGAVGYLSKDQATAQILDAIRTILAGKMCISQSMREKLLRRTYGGGKKPDQSPIDGLTDRELEVFRLIGEGVKTQEIAERLHVSIKTIETHRDRIKKKLGLQDGTELIRRAVLWGSEQN
ncbi:MAG TPA: response regulator transcription factor [Gemmataceae bacterium]|nr:response regulator transcription factor [Gemmataceae bacterium]